MAGVIHIALSDIGNHIRDEFYNKHGRYPSPEDYQYIVSATDMFNDREIKYLNMELDLHRINYFGNTNYKDWKTKTK